MNLSLKQLKVSSRRGERVELHEDRAGLASESGGAGAIIRELETQLDCRLFERTTRTVALTRRVTCSIQRR